MTRSGGSPMTVFLTPEGAPFFGGTYYPPTDGRGMPGFPRVLTAIAEAWKNRREEVLQNADQLREALNQTVQRPSAAEPHADILDRAAKGLIAQHEPEHGGFGNAPKFPPPMALEFLLRQWKRSGNQQALDVATHTLDHMARGGIYDHLGGGFARYSTDEEWLVPHFEKMLYDNALLTSAYLEAFQATRDPDFDRVARATMDYVLGRMTGPEGGFYSTED